MMIAFGAYLTDLAALTASISTVSWPPTARMSGFLEPMPDMIGVRSAFGGNSEFWTTLSPARCAPLAKPAAASFENGSVAPVIPPPGGLGRARDARRLVLGADRVHRDLHAARVGAEERVDLLLLRQPRDRVGGLRRVALAIGDHHRDLVLGAADVDAAALVDGVDPELVAALGELP